MNIKQTGIRKQLLSMLLGCILLTLLIAGGVSIYGLYGIRSQAIKTGREIENVAIENSEENLQRQIRFTMHSLLLERSYFVNTLFDDLRWSVESMATIMDRIHANPQDYVARRVEAPRRENAGKLVPQLLFESTADPNDPIVQREIGLAANLKDLMIRVHSASGLADDCYVASENGFIIFVDERSENKFDAGSNAPNTFDFSRRPWYIDAMREDALIFTDVYKDYFTDKPGITCAAPYHYADGTIAGVVGEGISLNEVAEVVLGTRIGETGFGFIINREGKVLFSPKTEGELVVDGEDEPSLLDAGVDPSLVKAVKLMTSGASGTEEVVIDGVPHYLEYMPLSIGFSFGIAIEVAETAQPVNLARQTLEDTTDGFIVALNHSIISTIAAMLLAILLFLLLTPTLGRKIAELFVRPIDQLSEGVREIAAGNLDRKLEIKTGNEIEHLAASFNAMTDEIKTQMKNLTRVTADKERISTELNVATNIQLSMLPSDFDFDQKEFEIYATMHAAKEVGGDFYDFYLLDEKHLVITIADVSGKGVPAALFMAISKTILKNFAMSMKSPEDFAAVMPLANQQLCQGNDEMMFVTVFMAMLDLESGRLIYVNGGHNPPMIYHQASDRFEYLAVEQNVVLGMMEDMEFERQETKLEAGDIIYLYTDGVTEAMDVDNKQYGEERLSVCLNGVDKQAPLEKILAEVRDDLSKHVGAAAQSDDITMLAVRFNGGEK